MIDMLDPNDNNRPNIKMLAQLIEEGKETFESLTQEEYDVEQMRLDRLKTNKYVQANAMMDSLINYIYSNFDGALLDWENGDPYPAIKIDFLKHLGLK